jgi:protein O-mannosyl-transferase
MNKKYPYLIILFLIIISFAAFGRIAGNDFINCDDDQYITENYHIQSGIRPENIKWASTIVVIGNWHPLTLLSHMLDWSLFGANAGGHHMVSLLLHIGTVIFLFLFLNKTTNQIWSSAFAAALFALHPLRVESVAWASERKDVLSMFFGMACLYAYSFYAQKTRISHYLLCLILFALALMSKPMMVTLPFVLMLLDYWPLNRWQKALEGEGKGVHSVGGLIGEKIPFIILTIASSIITFWAQNKSELIASLKQLSFPERGANAIVSYVAYLEKTFWPVNLTIFYPYQLQPLSKVLFSGIVITFITFAALYYIKKLPFLFAGWFIYLGTLIPVIGLVQVGAQSMADRYTYLPSIGIAIMISWGIPFLIKSENARRKILFPAAIAFLAVLALITWKQCGYWKNSTTIFSQASRVTENNYLAHGNLARALLSEGKDEEAIHHYNQAIALKPDSALPYNMLGNAYTKLSQYQLAINSYNQAINLDSSYANAYNNRGTAYSGLGLKERAIEDHNTAIRLKPDYADAYYNRGIVFMESVQYQNAVDDFSKAIHLQPDYIPAYFNRAITYSKIGHYNFAIKDYTKIINMKPDHADAYNNRGAVYLNLGNKELGCLDAQKACELGICKVLEMAKSKGDCYKTM